MGFDPQAYLAKKTGAAPSAAAGAGGFDPAAYLAKKTAPAVAAAAQEPEKGWGEKLSEGVSALGKGVGAIGSTLWSPLDTIRDASKRRQLARGFSDTVTFGLAEKKSEALETKFGGEAAANIAKFRQFASTQPPEVRAAMEAKIAEYEQEVSGAVGATGGWAGTREVDQKLNPEYRTGGQIAGAFVPGGGAGAAAKGGAAIARRVLPMAAKTRLGGAAIGLGKGLLGYEVAAPATAAVQSAVAGDAPADVARAAGSAATDPLGLLLSGGGGALGGAAKGQAARLRDPATLEGKTLQAIDEGGGQLTARGRGVRGGLANDPDVASTADTRAGMNTAAGRSRDTVKAHNAEKLKTERASYGEQMDAVLQENAEKLHNPTKTHAVLDTLEKENTLRNGEAVSAATKKAIDRVRRQLSTAPAEGDQFSASMPAALVDDMLKVKKSINDLAEWGKQSTVKNRRYRLIAGALKEDAATVDPRIAEMNKSYAATMAGLEEANDILFAQKKAELRPSAAGDKRAALKLGRVDDPTQAGTTDRLGRLAELDPVYAEELKKLKFKKAMVRVQYGEPETSAPIEQGMMRGAQRAVPAVVGGAVRGIPGAMVGAAAGSAIANPLALKLRLGLPAAEKAGRFFTGSSGSKANRLVELQRQEDERRRRGAATIGGQ